MGVVRFGVILDKPDKIYCPGETITGKVELVLDSEMRIRVIEMKMKGKAKCKLYEGGRSTKVYRSSEIYLRTAEILFQGTDKFKLPAGVYSYRFAAEIPFGVPASFSGIFGKISYYGKAKIYIPLAFDKKERIKFTVFGPLNLNSLPKLKLPYKDEKSKKFCCMCCASGPLTIVACLPKTAFTKLESIPITLEIDNASNVTVYAINVYLRRVIRYITDDEEEEEDLKLEKLRLGGVEEGQSQTMNANLKIPSISFPNVVGCSIIKINHEVHIEADPYGLHFDLDLRIPVTIADVLTTEPDAPIFTQQMKTFPDNQAVDPGMLMPAGEAIQPNSHFVAAENVSVTMSPLPPHT